MDTFLNYPIRKLFTCELQHVTFDAVASRWELKIKGRQVPIILVWLQGYLKQPSNYQSDRFVFSDATGKVDLWLTTGTAPNVPADQYYRLFAEIEDVVNARDRTVTLKAKTLTPLDGNGAALEDVWCAEVVDYHRFLQQQQQQQ